MSSSNSQASRGQQSKIDGIIEVLSEYEIIEIARTGAIALSRGPVPVKQM